MTKQKKYTLTRAEIMAIAQQAATDAVNMALCELMPDTSDPVAMMPDADDERPRRLSRRQREMLAMFHNS